MAERSEAKKREAELRVKNKNFKYFGQLICILSAKHDS